MQIHQSASRGDTDAVRLELDKGVPVDVTDQHGQTALMLATCCGKAGLDTMTLLLERGASMYAVAMGKYTPLRASLRFPDKFRLLLENGADLEHLLIDGKKVVPPGCASEVRKVLIERGFDPEPARLDELEHAGKFGDWAAFRKLVRDEKDHEIMGWTPVMCEIIMGTTDSLAAEMASGSFLNDVDNFSRTSFLLSVSSGDVEKAKLIHAAGGLLTDTGLFEASVMDYAVWSRSVEMLNWLINLGVDPNSRGFFNRTPLMTAVEASNLEAIKILCDSGGDLSTVDDCGLAPVNFADNAAVLEFLVKLGANLNFVDGTGLFPLKAAIQDSDDVRLRSLIALGADVNNHNFGATALHEAANYDNLDAMQMLLEAGANPNAVEEDVGEWMPLWQAKSREAVALLLRYGASKDLTDGFGKTAYRFHSGADFRDLLKGKSTD